MTAPPRWLRAVNSAANRLYDHRLGWLLGKRILRLTHRGRRSGRSYDTVLEVVGHRRDAEFFVVSGFGPRSDWLRNLDAGGPAAVTVGPLRFPADHRRLNEAEALAVLAEYERRNRLIRPVVHGALSWLLGWPYRGTDADRRLLVDQLPVIGLQPRRSRKE